MSTDAGERPARAPLAVELLAAAQAVAALEHGRRLPEAIEQAAARHQLAGTSRAALQDLAATATRQLARCKALAARLNRRAPDPALAALQWVALAQLLAVGAELAPGRRAPRHEAVTVDQAVAAARLEAAGAPAAGFLNATLRRFLREREALLAEVDRDEVARLNYPAWWIAQVRRDHPQHWLEVLEAGNQPPPLTLRVNRRVTDVPSCLAALRAAGHDDAVAVGPSAILLSRAGDVRALPGFDRGAISVQDAGAQLAAPLLDLADGLRVLDACAAPGGKAAHCLELADCELVALDADARRLARVSETLERLRLRARVVAGDARRPADWWDGRPFDRILLDAPCSASGIVRRQPDVRWLRRRSDLATLGATQDELLAALWPLLAPGGKLLYATCSVFRVEGVERIERFTGSHGDAVRQPLAWRWSPEAPPEPVEQLLPRSLSCRGDSAGFAGRDHDGFYYAQLLKRP